MANNYQSRPLRKLNIDLKYALWSADVGHWEDHAPDALALLRAAVESGDLHDGHRVTINTAPRKEIRAGTVQLSAQDGHVFADVEFHTEWDEPCDLAGSLAHMLGIKDFSANAPSALCDRLCVQELGAHEFDRLDLGESPTLAEVLARIDAVEERLLANDKDAWESLVDWAKEALGLTTEET